MVDFQAHLRERLGHDHSALIDWENSELDRSGRAADELDAFLDRAEAFLAKQAPEFAHFRTWRDLRRIIDPPP
jgi:hypothetical protein